MKEDLIELRKKTISGVVWRMSERILAQMVNVGISIYIARILMPEEYSVVTLVMIFINLANVLVTNGLGTSLIQKKEADEIDFSTMFYAGIILSMILYAILYLSAPWIAQIYKKPILVWVLRVMGLRIPFAAVNSIQQADVSRKMQFKKFFFATLFGTVVSAVVGIWMANNGYGAWAVVGQYLSNTIIDTFMLFLVNRWYPRLVFSISRFIPLFSFGWKAMLTSFIGTLFDQLKGLIIGVRYDAADLSCSNQGERIPAFIANNVNSTMASVLFPVISKVQDNPIVLKNVFRRMIKTSSYIIFPLMFGLAATSKNLVMLLLTEKWISCVPFMILTCIQMCFGIITNVNLYAIKSVGRSDISLKLEIVKKPIFLCIIIATMTISPIMMTFGSLIYSIIALLISSNPNKKLLDYSIREQIRDIMPNISIAFVMGAIVFFVGTIKLNCALMLCLQCVSGIAIYCCLSIISHNESFWYLANLMLKREKERV